MIKGGGGSVKIFRRKIFLSQCRNNLQGNSVVQCFRNMPVAKKLMDKGRGVSRFPVENFFSHSAECFVGPPFCAMFNKLSGGEKVYG